MDGKDPEVCPIVTAHYFKALQAADRIGAQQMAPHSLDHASRCRSSCRMMVDTFGSDAIALSIATDHADLASRMSGALPVDDFVRDAGAQLRDVHLQDLDDHADRCWAPSEDDIHWHEVFEALNECTSDPHLVLEPRRKSDIPKGFAYLQDLGLVA